MKSRQFPDQLGVGVLRLFLFEITLLSISLGFLCLDVKRCEGR